MGQTASKRAQAAVEQREAAISEAIFNLNMQARQMVKLSEGCAKLSKRYRAQATTAAAEGNLERADIYLRSAEAEITDSNEHLQMAHRVTTLGKKLTSAMHTDALADSVAQLVVVLRTPSIAGTAAPLLLKLEEQLASATLVYAQLDHGLATINEVAPRNMQLSLDELQEERNVECVNAVGTMPMPHAMVRKDSDDSVTLQARLNKLLIIKQ